MSVPMLDTEDARRVNRAITDIEAPTEKKESRTHITNSGSM